MTIKTLFVLILLITIQSLAFPAIYGEQRSIRIYVEPLPDGSDHVKNAIYDAIKSWEARGSVKFDIVSEKEPRDLIIKWVKEDSNFANEAGYYYKGLVSIALGDSSCSGIWQPYSSNTVSTILKHEIGHALGYDHSSDSNDIMYHKITLQYANGSICYQIPSLENYVPKFDWQIGIPILAVLGIVIGLGSMIFAHIKSNEDQITED